jgi:hypothetical protein
MKNFLLFKAVFDFWKGQSSVNYQYVQSVVWIRIGFNADPDPGFFSVGADPDQGRQTTYAMWSHKKFNISFKIILKVGR